eukprot:1746142-Rhodomonas_salina.1
MDPTTCFVHHLCFLQRNSYWHRRSKSESNFSVITSSSSHPPHRKDGELRPVPPAGHAAAQTRDGDLHSLPRYAVAQRSDPAGDGPVAAA